MTGTTDRPGVAYGADVDNERGNPVLRCRQVGLVRDPRGAPMGIMVFLTAADLRLWGADVSGSTVTLAYTSDGLMAK
jgi:hypothetical protein